MTHVNITQALLAFSEKAQQYKDAITNEAQTRTVLVEPLLTLLGYDVANPFEVIHEYTCDVGTKRGEKVDYGISVDTATEQADIIIEVKACTVSLSTRASSQLYRYYASANVSIAILTNGLEYWFFADTERENIMDSVPFYKVNITNITDEDIAFLLHLTKEQYSNTRIETLAKEYTIKSQSSMKQAVRDYMMEQLKEPSKEFVNFVAKQILAQNTLTTKAHQDFVQNEITFILQTSTYLMTGIEPTDVLVHVTGEKTMDEIAVGDNVAYDRPSAFRILNDHVDISNYQTEFDTQWARLLHDLISKLIQVRGFGLIMNAVADSPVLASWLSKSDDGMTEPIAIKVMYGSVYIDASLAPNVQITYLKQLLHDIQMDEANVHITFTPAS